MREIDGCYLDLAAAIVAQAITDWIDLKTIGHVKNGKHDASGCNIETIEKFFDSPLCMMLANGHDKEELIRFANIKMNGGGAYT